MINIEVEDNSRNDNNYEEAIYVYEILETGLFESSTIIEGLEFASIESLKKELNEQYGIIHFPEDKADDEDEDEMLIRETKLKEVIPKSESLWIVCKDVKSNFSHLKA